jgi:acetyl esterase/lipase
MASARLSSCLVFLLLAPQAASAQSQLWGSLVPGPDAVGFRSLYRFDPSRTWRATHHYDRRFTPDVDGRPVQINVWYPAAATETAARMRWSGYVRANESAMFRDLNGVMNGRNREIAEDAVPTGRADDLLAVPVAAYRNASPMPGLHPVVLYFGGLNAHPNSNAVLGEYLASHGYIVASISILGATDRATNQARAPEAIETTVRDMEFAWAVLAETADLHPDRTRLAAMGHSVGAIEAIALAMRNGNVSAVIGLDGTYGFRGNTTSLTDTYGYRPERMRAALFDVRRAEGQQGAVLDLSAVNSFRYADRTVVTVERMHHSDFTSFALIADAFQMPIASQSQNGWNRSTARRGYELVCELVLDFLDGQIKRDPKARAALLAAAERAGSAVVRHTDASAPLPTPWELANVAGRDGLPAAETLLTASCVGTTLGACVDEAPLNAFGYELLSQGRVTDAVAIFEINAWSHPLSANAQDSLADSFVAAGKTESARAALNAVIALAPGDPSLNAEQKASFVSTATARLRTLR